jgi:hypothetical protein
MIIIAYVWILCLVIFTLFILVACIIENNFEESHPVMKWWRKHIIAPDPEDAKYRQLQDDIEE